MPCRARTAAGARKAIPEAHRTRAQDGAGREATSCLDPKAINLLCNWTVGEWRLDLSGKVRHSGRSVAQ